MAEVGSENAASATAGCVGEQSCPQRVPENRETVLAIQGGGIFALPMLGQARVVLNMGYIPVGYAGSSGGAILATLLWAGRRPNEIEDAFLALLSDDAGSGLTDLLLPTNSDGSEFTLPQLHRLIHLTRRSAAKLSAHANWWQFWRRCNKYFAVLGIPKLWKLYTQYWVQKGVFCGERFENFVDEQIKLAFGKEQQSPLTFGDVREDFRPPLLLTTTNVSRGCLQLIDSTDPVFRDVEIAAAVRASAGFPGFFTPVDLQGVGAGRCFVDGGMISNFPLWAFSDTFRTKLQGSRDHWWLAPRPWLSIGLRVQDATAYDNLDSSMSYATRLAAISSGMARNELEDRLVSSTQRKALVIKQASQSLPINRRTRQPIDVLDVDAVTKDNLRDIIKTGEDAAENVFLQLAQAESLYTIYDPECGPAVLRVLNDLVAKCESAFAQHEHQLHLRANVFFPVEQRMEMRFSVRMDQREDTDNGLHFDSISQGVTGWVYQTRRPALCDLKQVAAIWRDIQDGRADPTTSAPFDMSQALQGKVRADRTWLISYPIFDPTERAPWVRLRQGENPPIPHGFFPALHPLKADMVGPILGILNVDSGWDGEALGLHREIHLQANDRRVQLIIDTVAQATLSLARHLVSKPIEEVT